MLSRCEKLMSLVEGGRISIKEDKNLDTDIKKYFNEYSESSQIG